MTASSMIRTRRTGGKSEPPRRRPTLPPALRSLIRRWHSLAPAVRQSITLLVDGTAAAAPPTLPKGLNTTQTPSDQPYSANPVIQRLFDALDPAERLLFGDRWFGSGKPPTPFIQGRPAGSMGHLVRFDGRTLQEQDGSGRWSVIRTVVPEAAR